MKKITFLFLLALVLCSLVIGPSHTFAKSGSDDDGDSHSESHSGHGDDDDDDDDNDDDDENDENDDDSDDDSNDDVDDASSDSLEVEADVFTDTTIVKVELRNGSKTVFETGADTRDEVIDAVVGRFNLSRSEVAAVLDFEVEDRASRAKDRVRTHHDTRSLHNDDDSCDADESSFEVEADVFTDTTIVKVERNGAVTVFETGATTLSGVVDAVASRFNLLKGDIEDVIDFEVEDRASRNADFDDERSNDDCNDVDDNDNHSSNGDDVQAQISRLQELIRLLTQLLAAIR